MKKMRNLKKRTCLCRFGLLVLISAVLLCLLPFIVLEEGEAAAAEKEENIVQEKKATRSVPLEKMSEKRLPLAVKRDPTKILPEIESQMEEVEPPEIRITGVIETRGRKAAIAELNLEDFEGRVMLEPGMTVSIPKPNREQSESKRWMTYFKVSTVNKNGVLLVLENGENIWVPVMGEKD